MKFTNYFYEPLKLNKPDVWFWSDLHMGHKCESWENPLWKGRGFSSVEEHDFQLIERWNEKISNQSIVFHLGDILFGFGGEERLTNLLDRLNFSELYLMFGNHHAGMKQILEKSSITAEGIRYIDLNYKAVYFIPNYFEMFVCGQSIVCSHYPIASWNGQSKGSFMIHGHCHGNLHNSEVGKLLYNSCKILDVGVECCPYPMSFSEIKTFFNNKENKTFDHHDSKTNNPF